MDKVVTWYTPEEKFPDLGDNIVYIEKSSGEEKKITYQTDWINKHKKHVDICFKSVCLKWRLQDDSID